MNKLEKLRLEHEFCNRFVRIEALFKQARDELKECEKYIDSIEIDGLTEKTKGGIIE